MIVSESLLFLSPFPSSPVLVCNVEAVVADVVDVGVVVVVVVAVVPVRSFVRDCSICIKKLRACVPLS